MYRFVLFVPFFVFFYFVSCTCPLDLPSKKFNEMKNFIDGSVIAGEVMLDVVRSAPFTLKLQHDPKKDIFTRIALQMGKKAFAAFSYECGDPGIGLKGTMTSKVLKLDNAKVTGVFYIRGNFVLSVFDAAGKQTHQFEAAFETNYASHPKPPQGTTGNFSRVENHSATKMGEVRLFSKKKAP